MNEPNEYFTISQLCKHLHRTRDTIYAAIRRGAIKPIKRGKLWVVTKQQVEEFLKNLYSRDFSKVNGKLKFDPKRGELSLRKAAEMLGISYQGIYYLVRSNRIPSIRKGASYVLYLKDVEKFKNSYLQRDGVSISVVADDTTDSECNSCAVGSP